MAKVLIINGGTTSVSIYLNGPASYHFTIPAKTVQLITILSGPYKYTYTLCGHSDDGSYLFKGKKRWTFWCTN